MKLIFYIRIVLIITSLIIATANTIYCQNQLESTLQKIEKLKTMPPPKKRPSDVMTEARAAEILKMGTIPGSKYGVGPGDGPGVMGEREGIPGPVSLLKQSDNNYAFKVEYSDRIIETVFNSGDLEKYNIPHMLKDSEGCELSLFEDILKNSKSIKVTFTNGDVFLGKVERSLFVYEPKEGEYRYSTGEIFTGDWGSRHPSWSDEIPIYGKMEFADGSIENGNWLQKYNVKEETLSSAITLTEKHNLAIRLYEEKQLEIEREKLAKQQKLINEQIAKEQEEKKKFNCRTKL